MYDKETNQMQYQEYVQKTYREFISIWCKIDEGESDLWNMCFCMYVYVCTSATLLWSNDIGRYKSFFRNFDEFIRVSTRGWGLFLFFFQNEWAWPFFCIIMCMRKELHVHVLHPRKNNRTFLECQCIMHLSFSLKC